MTVEELLAEIGVPAETIAAKQDVVRTWNGRFSEVDTKAEQAQKALQDAQALQRVIDENIASNGLNEANMAQLRASNAAMAAALQEVKKAGFSGITIPDFPAPNTQPNADPIKGLESLIVNGFSTIGQTLNIANRYQRVFGKALPDDPATLADEARARRMDVNAYAEQKYGFAAAEQRAAAEAAAKRETEIAERAVAKYKEEHPSIAGHPELNGGVDSRYPTMPKPREAASLREFAGMTARQKIAAGMQRATEAVAARSSAA